MRKISTILLSLLCMAGWSSVMAQTPNVIITEVYGGGGNSGATLRYDFIELYNTTGEDVDISGWSVQYYSATGTTKPGSGNVGVFPDETVIPAGEHFLVQAAKGNGGTQDLPTPNFISTLAMGGTSGKVVLYTTSEAQALDLASTAIKDYVPFGESTPEWGTPMPTLSNTTSATRKKVDDVYQYTKNIGADFEVTAPNPQSYAPDNQVLAPEFTPAAGNYFSAQNVTITCATDGATIRYTTDGTEPTATSNEYTAAIPVSTTTTINAKAFKAEMDESVLVTATYTFPTTYATIAELRTAELSSSEPVLYTGTAVVTFAATSASGNRNAKYIQDATSAILIDDANGNITEALTIGDNITNICGTLSPYNGMLQFVAATNATKLDTELAITPAVKTLAELTVDDQATLVTVKNVQLAAGTFTKGANAAINGTESVVVRPQYADLDYIGETIPGEAQDITAVVLVYSTTIQLVPRAMSDIVPSDATGIATGKVAVAAVAAAPGQIIVNAAAGDPVTVYDILGKVVVKTTAGTGETVIPAKAGQLLLVKVGGTVFKVIAK